MKKAQNNTKKISNDKIVKEKLNHALENSTFTINPTLKNEITDLVSKLKGLCNCARIPMFICLAVQNNESGTEYINDCVLASTEQSSKGLRISKLLLACNGAETKLPEYIQNDIRELTDYLDRLERHNIKDSVANVNLRDNKINEYLAIGEGLVNVEPPQSVINRGMSYDEDLDDLQDYND